MVNLQPKRDFVPHSAMILGSTGSVGTQTLDIVRELGIRVEMLTAGENVVLLAKQIAEFHPKYAAVGSREAAEKLSRLLETKDTEILWNTEEVLRKIEHAESDILFHSVAGLAGIPYAMAAAKSGKRIGMANKEAIIAVGELIFDAMTASGGEMIPVDSEHCAIYRCLEGRRWEDIKNIILTASGGPFFGKTADELRCVTAADALAHPTWKMGKKITIDSATLMNKGFEIMEAVRLFGVPEDKVQVVIHRQSIIHSMVEYNDNTLIAQMGVPDMRDCIRYAATAPAVAVNRGKALDFTKAMNLTLDVPDCENFPLLNAAREAIRLGGCAPTALIAADEVAVDAFLEEQIGFTDIASLVMETMGMLDITCSVTEDSVREADRTAREACRCLIQHYARKK